MARPGPIVLIPSEVAYALRRSGDEPEVGIDLVNGHIVLFSGPHAAQDALQSRGLVVPFLHHRADLPHSARLAGGAEFLGKPLDFLCDIEHPFQEEDLLSFNRDLLLACHRPEPVLQIVVLRGTELRDVRIRAVMVGDDQALVGDHASGTVESD